MIYHRPLFDIVDQIMDLKLILKTYHIFIEDILKFFYP